MPRTMRLTTGRRLALAVGLPFALASVGYAGLNYVSLAGQAKYSLRSTVLPEAPALSLSLGPGSLAVTPSADRRAHLDGEVNYSLVYARVEWRSTPTGVSVSGPQCFWIGNCGSDLRLALPRPERLHATLGDGSLDISGVRASLQISDGSGDIRLSRVSGPLEMSAGSGNISATGISSASVRASDSSGDVHLSFDKAPTMVDVHDGSGDITVVVPGDVAYRVVAQASSGSKNVGVPTNPASPRVIDVYDSSGNINVVPTGS